MIEDHGLARKALIVGTVCLSYALMATGLFARSGSRSENDDDCLSL